jgi:cytochrome c-type biogenesis protein CcmH
MLTAARRVALVGAALALGAAGAEGQRPRTAADSAATAPTRRQARDSARLDALTRQVASQLRCPVCQGLSLADSPSELALEMKDVVRDQLASGRTPDEVKQYFVAKYGEWILLEPERRGVNLLVYALPVLAVVAGLAVIWLALGKWTGGVRAGSGVPGGDNPGPDPAD